MKRWIKFFQRVFQEWNQDKVTRLAASLSYYTVFSLAPLLVIIIAVVGLIFGADVAQKQIIGQVQGLVGADGAQLIDSLLNNARKIDPSTNLLATIFALVAIVLGATGVVGELKDSLNTIWNVTPKPGNGLFGTFFERVLSLGMVLGVGFLLMVSLIVSASLAALGAALRGYFEQWVIIAQVLDLVISFGSIALLFALLFKFLPDVRVAWRDVWIGSVVTALLFTLGKYAIGLYLGNSNIASPFGAAGSLVILFVWIYYAAQILFLGAEITQVYSTMFGSGIQPASDAIPLSDAARVKQGTRTPDDPSKPKVPEAGVGVQPVPAIHSPALTFTPRGRFNPLELIAGALGVRIFGAVRKLFAFGGPTSTRAPRSVLRFRPR